MVCKGRYLYVAVFKGITCERYVPTCSWSKFDRLSLRTWAFRRRGVYVGKGQHSGIFRTFWWIDCTWWFRCWATITNTSMVRAGKQCWLVSDEPSRIFARWKLGAVQSIYKSTRIFGGINVWNSHTCATRRTGWWRRPTGSNRNNGGLFSAFWWRYSLCFWHHS